MKYKAIVIKLTRNKAIVSTDDFQCYYINRDPTIYVGKEVEFSDKDIINTHSNLTKLIISVACVLFAITCYFSITNMYSKSKVFAYIDVDINPSLEISIDRSGNVLNLVPLNQDASTFVDNSTQDKHSILETVDIIVDQYKKNSGQKDTVKDYILISSTLNSKKDNKDYQAEKEKLDALMNSLKSNIQKSKNASVFLLQSSINERQGARREGISTGRYALYNRYKNQKKDFSIEDAKSIAVNELIKGVLEVETETDVVTPTPITTNIATSIATTTVTPSPTSTLTSTPTPSPTRTPSPSPVLVSVPTITLTPFKAPIIVLTSTPTTTPTATATPTATPVSESVPTATNRFESSQFMRLESYNYRGYYIRHQAFEGLLSSYVEPEVDSVFKIVPGLADPNCVSFESKNYPGYYLKHENFQIYLREYDGSDGFSEDATFRIVPGIADENLMSFQSYNYPNRYIRHRSYYLWIEEINTDLEKKDSTYIGIKVQ